MKKIIIPFAILFILLIACSNEDAETDNTDKNSDTITYESENGPIEVPANPQRVVVLSSFAGNVMALDVDLVGVDSWAKMNPQWEEELADVEEVSDESLEKIIELEPDLIIGLSSIKNVDKLNEIAPTVTYTYGAVDYLTQHIEIGKLLNKEEEAKAWVDDFKQRAEEAGNEIRAEIGEEATVSVIESFDKQLYVYGDNWGRGTEILYQEMNLKMPEKVAEVAQDAGYYAMSSEVLPEYAGDYIIFSRFDETHNSFMNSDTYKNIPAVANNHVFEVNGYEFYFNDPLTLEYQLAFFKEAFLNK
ncbi:ABC transporter substrate-binding protein [Bacilli bacterium]|uniref:iron-hydroxamate ABC transporter substrate-binding protein n=1 Tax=Oceanobacillus TaxID=182709 RepID=UPI000621A2FC|nr:ABC transporter substrate-binding protein [Bacilli bacterium VT-13-104]PZD84847.1 ABC transporter substrate-binding protein [Bacilli bacterium]PZD86381.1 ABC transporter substrate-binding protein [Bacilli bacterium]PZD89828.1 ABC transporter substrate-binding protein [Bacilli bacterium]RCO05338.1 ABC transporter substrate-binding protein [Bacilli bacterium]